MRWLHGLLYHRQQMVAQRVQVDFTAQRRTEGCQCLGRIILQEPDIQRESDCEEHQGSNG